MVATAHMLGPGSLKLGETASQREIAAQLTKFSLEPKSDFEDDVPVLSGETVPGDASTDWSIKGTANQDFDKESIEMYCYQHRLQDVPFLFTPSNDHDVSWSGVCTVVPLTVGGDVKKKNTSDFEFRVIGEPTPVDSTGTPLELS
ncbi:hypothetical protein GCM10017714_33640 [Curtobacterium pusillum]|uniref:Major tail protein n=1 Tax=Curtobacterium pusillum TaxID=69373 RepID=A0ABX2MAB2_9MICO|nr:hypothetical protein [Curtobacterium pusillum]NUU12712.1 hypothetical protein [Curtobacterium pusillum]GLK31602.1 hypothetical protein GCM10017610_18870 [Curtobacterium pusillum]